MRRSLDVLEAVLGCELCDPRMVLARSGIVLAMPGKQYRKGGLAFMSDAPSDADDETGKPLSPRTTRGRKNTGQVFNDLLREAGIDREDVLVLNRVRCHPLRNRIDDFPEALTNCDPWNALEMATYEPAVVVLMGARALEPIFGAKPNVGREQGTWRHPRKHEWGERSYLATYHAAAVLRNQELFPAVSADFERANRRWKEDREEQDLSEVRTDVAAAG